MANPRYNGLAGKGGGKADYFEQADGNPGTAMPMKTANWPGTPGKTQPRSRANGMPTSGHCGPFQHKKEGL